MSFCPNCGNEIKDGVKFCTSCGNAVNSKPTAAPKQPKETASRSAKPAKNTTGNGQKKKAPLAVRVIVSIVVILVVLGTVSRVVEYNNSKNYDSYDEKEYSGEFTYNEDGSVSYQSGENLTEDELALIDELNRIDQEYNGGENQIETGDSQTENAEYTAIFTDRGIYDESALAGYGLSTGEFVTVTTDGIVEKQEFGYQNDIVKVLADVIYYPVSDYSDDEKTQVEDYIREQFAAVEALSFSTVNYTMGTDYLKIEIILEDLDTASNLQAAASTGIVQLTDSAATSVAYSQSESALLAAGYIQK